MPGAPIVTACLEPGRCTIDATAWRGSTLAMVMHSDWSSTATKLVMPSSFAIDVSSGSASACRSRETAEASAAMRAPSVMRLAESRTTRPWSSSVRTSRYAIDRCTPRAPATSSVVRGAGASARSSRMRMPRLSVCDAGAARPSSVAGRAAETMSSSQVIARVCRAAAACISMPIFHNGCKSSHIERCKLRHKTSTLPSEEGIDDDAVPSPRLRVRRSPHPARGGHRSRPSGRPPRRDRRAHRRLRPRRHAPGGADVAVPSVTTRLVERGRAGSSSARPTASRRAASRRSRPSASPSASSPRRSS